MAHMAQAIRMALHVAETQLGVTDIFGEDVGPPLGGVFTCTQGLKKSWNTPLDERGIIGMAIGLALAGQKPVAEIQFSDYIFNTIDLLKLAGNSCWSSIGTYPLNMVVMTPNGAGIHGSIYHSHSFDSVATHMGGWKIVVPSTPIDAYGLLLSAVDDGNPVLFMPPKALLRIKGEELIPGEPTDEKTLKEMIDKPIGADVENWNPKWPETEIYKIPLGQAKTVRAGGQAVILTYGRYVSICKKVADRVSAQGLGETEVIDLRTIYPYDWAKISESVQRTGRILIINEDSEITNFGEHLLRRVIEEHYYELRARPRLRAGAHVPGIGLADNIENASVPQELDIENELKALLSEKT